MKCQLFYSFSYTIQEDALRVLPPAPELSHGLDLLSAYRSVLGEEPPYTNFTTGKKTHTDTYLKCK